MLGRACWAACANVNPAGDASARTSASRRVAMARLRWATGAALTAVASSVVTTRLQYSIDPRHATADPLIGICVGHQLAIDRAWRRGWDADRPGDERGANPADRSLPVPGVPNTATTRDANPNTPADRRCFASRSRCEHGGFRSPTAGRTCHRRDSTGACRADRDRRRGRPLHSPTSPMRRRAHRRRASVR